MADLIISEHSANYDIIITKRWHLSPVYNIKHLVDQVQIFDCDLTDPHSVLNLIESVRPDLVFHFAAESFVSPSWINPSRYNIVNVQGTINLLEALVRFAPDAVVHIPGSGEEYGDIAEHDLPITPKTSINPVNPYAVSKVGQDLIAKVYFDSYGLKVIRTRTFNHEGPRRLNVFGLPWYAYQIALIEQGLKQPVIETGRRSDLRNFTHVEDIVRAYWLAVQHCKPGKLYLVGSVEAHSTATFDQCLHRMISMSSHNGDYSIIENPKFVRPTSVPNLTYKDDDFHAETGWKPIRNLDDIIRDTLGYWRRNYDTRGIPDASTHITSPR
jgi:GDP-4-dehydro-6-deoxy-D-mannose reductase